MVPGASYYATVLGRNYDAAAGSGSLNVDFGTLATPLAPDLDAASDSGDSNIDNITKAATPHFTGTTIPAASVNLFIGGTLTAIATSAADGTWDIPVTMTGTGLFSITCSIELGNGGVSAISPALSVQIDRTAPAAPPQPNLIDDSGQSSIDNITNDNTPRFTGAVPTDATSVQLLTGLTILGSVAAGGSTWTITSSVLSEGPHNIFARAIDVAGNISGNSTSLSTTIDTIAPRISSALGFDANITPHQLKWVFSENLGNSLTVADVSAQRLGVGPIASGSLSMAYSAAALSGTLTFPGVAVGRIVPNGRYTATLAGGGITDLAGNAMGGSSTIDFLFLRGDLNGDGSVSIADFIALASNFGKSNATYSDGDVNYDGTVSIADFIDLAANFNVSLPPAAPAISPQAPAAAEIDAPLAEMTILDKISDARAVTTKKPALVTAHRPRHHHRRRNFRSPVR